jgi:predicted nuclease with TOPRIM domain
MKKSTLTEELNRMKNLMVYKTDNYRHELNEEISSLLKEEMSSLLKEAPNDEVKEVELQTTFESGKWKDTSMPKQEILGELKEAVQWLKTKSELIKQSGGIIDGKAKILTIQTKT